MRRLLAALDYIKKTNSLNSNILDSLRQDAVDSVVSGEVNPIDAYMIVHFLELLCSEIRKDIQKQTINYIETSGEKTAYTVPVIIRQKPNWDYMVDEKYRELSREAKNMTETANGRKDKLKKDIEAAIKNNLPSPIPALSYETQIVIDYKKGEK